MFGIAYVTKCDNIRFKSSNKSSHLKLLHKAGSPPCTPQIHPLCKSVGPRTSFFLSSLKGSYPSLKAILTGNSFSLHTVSDLAGAFDHLDQGTAMVLRLMIRGHFVDQLWSCPTFECQPPHPPVWEGSESSHPSLEIPSMDTYAKLRGKNHGCISQRLCTFLMADFEGCQIKTFQGDIFIDETFTTSQTQPCISIHAEQLFWCTFFNLQTGLIWNDTVCRAPEVTGHWSQTWATSSQFAWTPQSCRSTEKWAD